MIKCKRKRSITNGNINDPLVLRNRIKANSYILNTNKTNKKKTQFQTQNLKDKKSKEINKTKLKLSKKISLLKSKKNSIKRKNINKSKIKRNYGGFHKKMKIRLDISQNLENFKKDSDIETKALKSCSMKNTITKFKFDCSLEMKNFEIKPKFKETKPIFLNDSRREKSINLIYKGKSKLKRNHTTKLLRNISRYQDNHVESKYAKKNIPRIYEKKEKRSLVTGIRNQIQSRKKQKTKKYTIGNELIKKPGFKKSELMLKQKKFNKKHSRSFRRKNSIDKFELKSSFQKSNELFYQQKKNQSLLAKSSTTKNLHLDTLILNKTFKNQSNVKHFTQNNKLDKVSENEEENFKCRSQNSQMKNSSLSVGEIIKPKEKSRSYDAKRKIKHTSVQGGELKRKKGGKLPRMCIYAKKKNKALLLEEENEKKKETNKLTQEVSDMEQDYEKEKKFVTLKTNPKEQTINKELKTLYHKKKCNQFCYSLNGSQKQITSKLGEQIDSRSLVESKMIDSKLGTFEDGNHIQPGKMASSLAVMENSKNGKMMMEKNHSMFQERKMESKQLSNLHTPRVSKHDLVKNLYQPESHGRKYLANQLQELNWPISHLNKSRDKIKESMKDLQEIRIQKKSLLKNSKKMENDKSSGLSFIDIMNKKGNHFEKYKQNFKKPKIKKYVIKRMEKTELRKAVMKDHQNQKANYDKIIKNFNEGRPDKKKRTSHSNHTYEPKFNKKMKSQQVEVVNEKTGYHEVVHSMNHDMYIQNLIDTSMNKHDEKLGSEDLKKSGKPKQKKYKTSLQKDNKISGYSQREMIVPKDFKAFNNKIPSGEGFDLKRDYIGHKDNKESFRENKKGVFHTITEKYKKMEEGMEERMKQKKTQLFNKRTMWRDGIIKNQIPCLKKTSTLKYTKSKKKINKPGLMMLYGKMKQSFLNKQKFETDLDKKLTRTNISKEYDQIKQFKKSKKQPNTIQNKVSKKDKTLTKTKSKIKLDRMLKNRNFNQKDKNKINLSSQFKVLKKSVGKNNFNKEQELEDDKKKYLANFNIVHFLGKGSYAEVHMAYDKVNNCLVAIKMYERYKLRDEIRSENLQNELKILKQLDHKNIIKLYDHIHGEHMEFLIMENGPKQMLNDFAKNYHHQRILEYEAKIIFQQILEAVSYLHNTGIIHRDLKMQNILINEKFEIKLIDFGFANFYKKKKKFNVFCGTYSYMAPELVTRIPYDGKATDVWSIGVLLYIMLTGDFPFKGTNQTEMTNNIKNLNYSLPSFLNPEVCELFKKIFVIDYKQRLSIDKILDCDWLLDVGKETDGIKDNQSTIFMESIDHMFNYNKK